MKITGNLLDKINGGLKMRTKKRWTWTEKYIRKQRNSGKRGFWSPPSKSFKEYFQDGYRASIRQSLHHEKNDLKDDVHYFSYRRVISETRWRWW